MSTGIEPCQGILGHQDTYDDDVGVACTVAPSDTIQSCVVDECPEDELARLMLRCRCEDGDDDCGGTDCVPPNGNSVQVFQKVDTEGVDET